MTRRNSTGAATSKAGNHYDQQPAVSQSKMMRRSSAPYALPSVVASNRAVTTTKSFSRHSYYRTVGSSEIATEAVNSNSSTNRNNLYFQMIDSECITNKVVEGIMQRRLSNEGTLDVHSSLQRRRWSRVSNEEGILSSTSQRRATNSIKGVGIVGAIQHRMSNDSMIQRRISNESSDDNIGAVQRRLSNNGGGFVGATAQRRRSTGIDDTAEEQQPSSTLTIAGMMEPQTAESLRLRMEEELEEGRELIRSMTKNRAYSQVNWKIVVAKAKELQEKEQNWLNLRTNRKIDIITHRHSFFMNDNVIDDDDDATYWDDDRQDGQKLDDSSDDSPKDDNDELSKDDKDDDSDTPKTTNMYKTEKEILDELLNDTDLNSPHPALECAPFYFILQGLHPRLLGEVKKLYIIRWSLSYPLQKRIPASRWLSNQFGGIFLTWGEALLILPFITFVIMAFIWSFVNPSVSITGHACRTPLILAFLTGMRNSFITLILGMPFERALWYHKLSGRVAFISAIFHTYVSFCHPVQSSITGVIPETAATGSEPNFGKFVFDDSVNVGGTCLVLSILVMLVTSVPYIRRKIFELFYFVHIIFAVACLGCAFYHTGVLVPLLGAFTWGMDLLVCKLYMAGVRYPKQATIKVLSDTVVELSFPKTKNFSYNPGQYVRIAVPELSIFEWHPFSLSSCPLEDTVTLYIRKAGTWTTELHNLADQSTTKERDISILLEGPYGSVGLDLTSNRYKLIMLFSGGIGVTPMQSVCNQLVFEHTIKTREIKRLGFYWMERDPRALQAISSRNNTLHSIRDLSESVHGSSIDDTPYNDGDSDNDGNGSNLERTPRDEYEFEDVEGISRQSIAISVRSDIEQGVPLSIAQTVFAFVPQSKVTDEELVEEYPVNDDHDNNSLSFFSMLKCSNKNRITRRNSLNGTIGTIINLGGDSISDSNGNHEIKQTSAGENIMTEGDLHRYKFDDIEAPSPTGLQGLDNNIKTTEANDDFMSSPSDVLDMNFFLTAKNITNHDKIANHEYVTLGRPDINEKFKKMKEDAITMGEHRVAVCICAPARLVHICKKAGMALY